MITLRRIRALVLGQNGAPADDLHSQLEHFAVPVTAVDCRSCSEPCSEGHESYPNRFSVDMDSIMLGSVKPYHSQVVISTGVADWDREITHTSGSLAYHLAHLSARTTPVSGSPSTDAKKLPRLNGVFTAEDSTRLSILNASHRTISDDPDHETILVFPDYKVVTGVARSEDGARRLWDHCLSPERFENISISSFASEKLGLNSWVIPYSCVILLCSHKRRDNRCHIAAAKLETEFTRSLESKGWKVDTQLDHPMNTLGLPLEEFRGTAEEMESHILKQLQGLRAEQRALILRNSHIGGHRYAGNCIIYTPQGSGVWYGRLTPHEVDAVVSKTLEDGVILPQLLRGGINIARPGCRTLHDW